MSVRYMQILNGRINKPLQDDVWLCSYFAQPLVTMQTLGTMSTEDCLTNDHVSTFVSLKEFDQCFLHSVLLNLT